MSKLIRPPHVPHWVRYNHPCEERTLKDLLNFARAMPTITYAHGLKLISDRLRLGVNWNDIFRSASAEGHTASRKHVQELVSAYSRIEDKHDLLGHRYFDQEVLPFRISRQISVPVRPLLSLIRHGKLEPIFVIGWASVPLTEYQKRLLMTVLEDAVFSLTDFQSSSGYIFLFPRTGAGQTRRGMVWKRGDFNLLSQRELQEQVEIYLSALDRAQGQVASHAPRAKPQGRPSHFQAGQQTFDL